MRTPFSGEIARLNGATYNIHVNSESQDADGTWQSHNTLQGRDWQTSFKYRGDADTPYVTGTIELARADRTLSMAPLMTGSLINRNAAAAYAPFLDVGRRFRVKTAITASGVAPVSGDWRYVCEGYIDKVGIGGRDDNSIVVECRDLGALLVKTDIEVIRQYGSSAGVPVQTVMQSILDDNLGVGAVTLYTPVSPSWLIHEFSQKLTSVMEAIRALAKQIGYEVRYVYDASNVLRLTFYAPDRAKVVSDYTIGPGVYTDVRELDLDIVSVRNAWTVEFIDRATGNKLQSVATSAPSIAQYGRLPAKIAYGYTGNIDSMTEADKMTAAAVADTAFPKASEVIDLMYYPLVDIADLITLTANGEHYDTDQQRAIVAFEHDLRDGDGTTVLTTRGKPAGGYDSWMALVGTTVEGPSLTVLDTPGATDATAHSVSYTGVWDTIMLSLNGGAFAVPAASPLSVTPNPPGGPDKQLVFRAVKAGQTVTQSIVVRPQGSTGGQEILSDPAIHLGLSRYTVYDNPATGKVVLSVVADSTAPNASGKVLRINVAVNSQVVPAVSPGMGGFFVNIPPDSGVAAINTYHRGAKIIATVRAKIPVGYYIEYTSNAAGTGYTQQWLTPQDGTGGWFDYKIAINIGVTGSFATIGFWYIQWTTGNPNAALQWDVAKVSMIDQNQSPQSMVWPTVDLQLKNKSRTQAVYTLSGMSAPGMPPIAFYSSTEYQAGSDTEGVAAWVAYTGPTVITYTRAKFYDKIARVQVQDSAGNVSDIIEQPISAQFDAIDDTLGRLRHDMVMDVTGHIPFSHGYDDATGVIETGGQKFVDGGALDVSRRPINVYRSSVYEPTGNLFKSSTDTAALVVETSARNFTNVDQIDAGRRIVAVKRVGVNAEAVDNLFKNNDAATFVNTTSTRAFVDPSATGGSSSGPITVVYRLGVNEPVNNLVKAGDALSFSGGTVSGSLFVTGYFAAGAYAGAAKSNGDIVARRSSTTGVIYFGESASTYLYWDGTYYFLGGGFPLQLGNIYITGSYGAGIQGITTGLFHTRESYMGYSAAYKVIILGHLGGAQRVLSLGVDLTANASGAFSGNGTEIITPNVTSWLTPNAANNNYLSRIVFDSAGGIRVPGPLSFGSGSSYAQDDGTYLNWVSSGVAFYINASFPVTYIYSANIFLGNTSGAAVHIRGNILYFGSADAFYIYAADVGPVTYGTFRMGGARNGYTGVYFDNWGYYRMNNATIDGHYHPTYSWRWYFSGGATDSWWSLYCGAVIMTAGAKFYPDGGGDTYIYESGSNLLDIVTGGAIKVRFGNQNWLNYSSDATAGGIVFYTNTAVLKGRVYWDAGGIGFLNDQDNWSIRCNYGSSYGGTLFGPWAITGALTLSGALSISTSLSVTSDITALADINVTGAVKQKKGTSTLYETPTVTISSSAAPGSSSGYPTGHIWIQVTAPV